VRPGVHLHSLEHVPFEDAAGIADWAASRGHRFSATRLYDEEPLLPLDAFDWLVIMGGSMSVAEEVRYPWLVKEKRLIEEALGRGKPVLGICLGAQLIANVLGARISPNRYREIGWFPVILTDEARSSPLFAPLPKEFTAFHWHSDTFDLPRGAIRVAESAGCRDQGFAYGEKTVGLQFHLESTVDSVERLIRHCGAEIVDGPYMQSPTAIRACDQHYDSIRSILFGILDRLERAG
jgi:GMP synthase-like glutamine amidotransferase